MRTLIVLILAAFISFQNSILFAQEAAKSRAFELVKENFNKMYPGAVIKEWELEKNNIYEVEFILNNIKYEAEFAGDGTWIYTERDINLADIPGLILNNFKMSEFSSWQIDEVEELNTPQHRTLYELELKKDNEKLYLYYLPDGTLTEQLSSSRY